MTDALLSHRFAELFPLLDDKALHDLATDIAENGLREPVVLFEGLILDGRNRYRAARLAEVECRYSLFDPTVDGDPLAWVLSKNLHRRHLNESQRAMVAGRLAKMRQGRPSEWNRNRDDKPANLRDLSNVKQGDAAELLHVSERSVQTARRVQDKAAPEVIAAVDRGEVAVSAAADLAELPEDEQLEILRTVAPRLIGKVAKEHREIGQGGPGGRATRASRVEPSDSLDFFPTPPWATRALLLDVLGDEMEDFPAQSAWEPACGEGHISGVLEERFGTVVATDVHDYSDGERHPPGWRGCEDFIDPIDAAELDADLAELGDDAAVDWIITNPPFSGDTDRALAFALRALKLARRGVALFVRTQWLEGIARYNQLFSVHPPTVVAQFAERVSLFRGTWDPKGSKPDQYCWVVWIKDDLSPTGFEWIPPGRAAKFTREGDVERFNARPARSLFDSATSVVTSPPAPVAPESTLAAVTVHEVAGGRSGTPQSEVTSEMAVQPDEPVDPAGATPLSSPRQAPVAAEGPEDEPSAGEAAAPSASPAIFPAPRSGQEADFPGALTSDEQNAIIREGYARSPRTSTAALMAATGLRRSAVFERAKDLGLTDKAHQRAAVAEANKRRAGVKRAEQ